MGKKGKKKKSSGEKGRFAKPQNIPQSKEAQQNFDKHNLSDIDRAKLNKDAEQKQKR